jgi:hypothetical protein
VIHLAHPGLIERNLFSALALELGLDESTLGSLEEGFQQELGNVAETGLLKVLDINEAPGMPDEALIGLRRVADRGAASGQLLLVALFVAPTEQKSLRQSRSKMPDDRSTMERSPEILRETAAS